MKQTKLKIYSTYGSFQSNMEDNTSYLKRKANYGQFVMSKHKNVGPNEVKRRI